MKLIVSIILSLFLIVVALNKNYSFKEGFASTSPIPITSANIADYIYNVYKADVKAIQNLADVAMKLQEGGITVPVTMTVSNQLNVGGIAEITGATKLKSTLDVTGDITGKTIKELQDKITALEEKITKTLNDKVKPLEEKTAKITFANDTVFFDCNIQVNYLITARGGKIIIGRHPGVYIRSGSGIWGQPDDPYVLKTAGAWQREDALMIRAAIRNIRLELRQANNNNFDDAEIYYYDDTRKGALSTYNDGY